ncbi:MAG: hypothetical protein A3K65_02910 [Euryarchaeota archaeon RBG_16_68_12]|nr:MAG: hypothetical protein A3K65_02910 [Euryarchaeota archaeon RBG_16_68_12]
MGTALYAAGAIFVATHVLISAEKVGLAGNATIPGAAANAIIVQAASRQGVEISFRDWVRAGLPAMVATLVLAVALLAALP